MRIILLISWWFFHGLVATLWAFKWMLNKIPRQLQTNILQIKVNKLVHIKSHC